MNVLITGAAGFIGSHLYERFSEAGHHVTGIDNLETGSLSNCPHVAEIDICDRHALYAVGNFNEPDLVVHCAASYKDPNKWHRDTDTNITGTINATLVAKHHGARLVYFQTALPPVSSYAISKIAGQQYIELSGVSSLIFRLANVYGPRNLSGPIPTFYKRLKAGEPCTVVDTRRDMVFIEDALGCFLRAIDEEAEGVYDVCSGFEYGISDIYREVSRHFPGSPAAKPVHPSGDDVPTELAVENRFRNWGPSTSLADGIDKACAWYEENGVGETFTHLKIAS